MDYAKIVLLFLKLADAMFTYFREQGLIRQGQDAEIARSTAAILAKTEYAKNVRAQIAKLDDAAVDKLLHDLEPK